MNKDWTPISAGTKETREDLEESRRLLHLVLDTAGVGTWIWNLVTNEILDLGNTANILGIEKIVSLRDLVEAIHPEDRSPIQKAIASSRNTGRYDAEWRVVLPDGRIRRLRGIGSLFHDGGDPPRMACALRDV